MVTDAGMLTTAELLKGCADATGAHFSVHQLGDWVTEGLLPPSRPGRGRGQRLGGTEPRLWEGECLPRLKAIAKSRSGKNVSVPRAASALAKAGYSPGPKHLRALLSGWLFDWTAAQRAPLERKRAFLKQNLPAEEKRRRFHRSDLRRYGATVNPAFRATVERLKLVALGLAETTSGEPVEEVFAAFAHDRLNAALQAASDKEVAEAFRIAGEVLPETRPIMLAVYAGLAGMAEALASIEDKRDAEATANLLSALHDLVSADPPEFAAMLRLPYTLIALYVRKLDPTAVTTLHKQMDAAFHQLIALLMSQMEESYRSVFQAALATAMNPMTGTPGSPADQVGDGERPTPENGEEQTEQGIR